MRYPLLSEGRFFTGGCDEYDEQNVSSLKTNHQPHSSTRPTKGILTRPTVTGTVADSVQPYDTFRPGVMNLCSPTSLFRPGVTNSCNPTSLFRLGASKPLLFYQVFEALGPFLATVL